MSWPACLPIKCDAPRPLPAVTDLERSFEAAQQALVKSAAMPGDAERETSARKLLEWHARANCLSLCDKVSRLPRELRDQVYSHLTYEPRTYMTDLSNEVKPREIRWRKFGRYSENSELPRNPPVIGIKTQTPEHIWDAEYVGVSFLQEMIDNWYRTAEFWISIIDEPQMMKLSLEKDQLQDKMKRIGCLKFDIRDSTDEKMLEQIVEDVKLLTKGSRVEIYFRYIDIRCVSDGGKFALGMHCKFVDCVIPRLERIEQAGYDVSLHIDELQFKLGGASAPDGWTQMLKDKQEKDYQDYLDWARSSG